jgi:hypothetical protein
MAMTVRLFTWATGRAVVVRAVAGWTTAAPGG